MWKVILGAQWGDEGKGRVVDNLSRDVRFVVRFNGGGNAGHTIWDNDTKYVLHILPSGIVRPQTVNLCGPGVVHDLEVVHEELALARACGSTVILDRSAPVVLPLHKLIDEAREKARGGIGTTKCGIGPCYEDLASRRGVKLGHLTRREKVHEALTRGGYYEEKAAILSHFGVPVPSLDEVIDWCMSFSDELVPHLGDTRAALALADSSDVLFEGAQGVLLDLIHGSHPFVTSSYCTLGGVSASLGVYDFDRVIGVTKAYITRVGEGPFPTEQENGEGDFLRTQGHEYGATTGRPRRCGWLDLVALRYAARVGGLSELMLTKLDVLSGIDEIKVCTGYRLSGEALGKHETLTRYVLERAEPLYETLLGWREDISDCRSLETLPRNAQVYVQFISEWVGLPITAIGVGPERQQMIWRKSR
ncbi:adenylosuccinate synthase [Candidatus Uhrbacteria bacterium CG_4_9_14_3_um_filter_50_9]|uniref:Adenylosuccinate synthetase n=1 Tax=Candidatus Uhrbacteria bacterium CG_4_9_14_3_um_filter_50_9 TaxID=1975035 RepID=A0A2M7XBL1_9BACT|nr:MAG: adenylosuccinate synthase [Candidatus Uhrbacteria bacterium CG_4_9_14_3_um_filter_50_9]